MNTVNQYLNVLTNEDINYILNLSEVIQAKNDIDKKTNGSVYFNVNLTPEIKNTIKTRMGLNLTNINDIPMRWIKGDTMPHIDKGLRSFNNTYLMYLTDSLGNLIVNNSTYTISKGNGYIFNEGIHHETINTGFEPRLLLGPMSEEGFVVGTSNISQAGGTIYIQQSGSVIQYLSDYINWTTIPSWPVRIINTDTSSILNVLFVTNITLNNAGNYFIVESEKITFDGQNYKVTIDGVTDYPGFIQNGLSYTSGYNNILVKSFGINTTNSSTLAENAGWIGQAYFSTSATGCIISFCNSTGVIGGKKTGGICGAYAGGNNGHLAILNCYSTGEISGTQSGGICGRLAGSQDGATGGNCEIINCYSIGNISGPNTGGICGQGAAAYNGICTINNCYSIGNIGISNTGCGGICADYAAIDGGSCNVTNCYSTGNIGISNGGIFGDSYDNINAVANHCYTSGQSSGSGPNGGIYAGSNIDNVDGSNNFSEADNSGFGWNTSNAINTLQNASSALSADTIWINPNTDTPFLLYGSMYNSDYYYFNNNFYSGTTTATIPPNTYTNLTISPNAGNFFWIIPPSVVSINTLEQMTSNVSATIVIINGFQDVTTTIEASPIYGYNAITFILTIEKKYSNSDILWSFYSSSSRKKTAKKIKKYIDNI